MKETTFEVIGFSAIGLLIKFFGGYDTLLKTLIMFVIIDFITGVVKAIKGKKLDSNIAFWGIVKKIYIFVLIGICVQIQKVTNDIIPLRETIIFFFIATDGMSIVKNIGEFIPIPSKIIEVFESLNKKE